MEATTTIAPGSLRAWVLAARPATLTAALVPVLVGTAVARAAGGFRAGPALAALFGAFMLQITSNFANDVFDHEKGADTHERLGPTRAVQSGLLTARQVRVGLSAHHRARLPRGRLPHGRRRLARRGHRPLLDRSPPSPTRAARTRSATTASATSS